MTAFTSAPGIISRGEEQIDALMAGAGIRDYDHSRVTTREGVGELIVGAIDADGCLTITDDDTVTVWAAGDEAGQAVIPGAFAHYNARA